VPPKKVVVNNKKDSPFDDPEKGKKMNCKLFVERSSLTSKLALQKNKEERPMWKSRLKWHSCCLFLGVIPFMWLLWARFANVVEIQERANYDFNLFKYFHSSG
jgi:hypothetical protein